MISGSLSRTTSYGVCGMRRSYKQAYGMFVFIIADGISPRWISILLSRNCVYETSI